MKRTLFILLLSAVCGGLSAGNDIVWTNPLSAGAEVYGQGWKELRNTYLRLPAKAEGVVPKRVWSLGKNSAGLSLVFKSDAPEIHVRYQVKERQAMFHMPATGVSGIDLYATDSKGVKHFVAPEFAPSFKDTIKYHFPDLVEPVSHKKGSLMTYRLSLPLYNSVDWLEIGVPEGCRLEFVPVPNRKPIVIYGSSITQGGCCSRPSMAWPSIVASELDREVVNLGFSGSGKGEKEVFDLISEIDADVFVVDCLPNMSLSLPIKDRILYGVRKYRETHDCPILLAEYSVCGQEGAINVQSEKDANAKNVIMREVYDILRKEGVKNLHYLKAEEWDAGMDGYVEGEHPNDFGMKNLAEGMTRKLREILGTENNPKFQYTGVKDLNLYNKLVKTDTPFGRFDPEKVGKLNYREYNQALECSGLAVAFNTNSTIVGVKASFSFFYQTNHTPNNAKQGFDLYVKKDGKWVWSGVVGSEGELGVSKDYIISKGLDPEMKECIVYFPLGSIMTDFQLITEKGSVVEKGATPFKGRIAVFGSSFTQGAGCSRCGMTYSAQLTRMTGLNFINMGFSGQSKLQPYFAHALTAAQNVDAYVVDGFSNPSAKQIIDRLFPFIEIFQKEKPGVPLIFVKTVFREKVLTHKADLDAQNRKLEVVDSLMKIAVKKYDNVYYVNTTNTIGNYHECTTDGIHPDQHGYTLWAESIKKPIVRILRKYL